MCYFLDLDFEVSKIEKRFQAKAEFTNDFDLEKFVKGPGVFPDTPVITDINPGIITPYRWGLIPFWNKGSFNPVHTLNARIESLTEKPSFRNSVNKRCLVLVNGFYEWKWLDEKGKQKEKYRIITSDNEPFALAGLYSHWKDPSSGNEIKTYTIVTTDANPLMVEIHNTKKRMPVVLQKGDEQSWLQNEDHNFFKFPGYESDLVAELISPQQKELF